MNSKKVSPVVLAAAHIVMVCAPIFAHAGPVVRFSQLYCDVTDKDEDLRWSGETRTRLKPGNKVTLVVHPSDWHLGTCPPNVVLPDVTIGCSNA
jgi:hypothetical protein